MALTGLSNGQVMDAAQVQQLIDLLTGVMTNQQVTLRSAASYPLLLDRSDAAGIKPLLAGQRAAATKWWLGHDASDHFAILNAAGNAVNWGVDDSGNVSVVGNETIAGLLSANAKITGTGGVQLANPSDTTKTLQFLLSGMSAATKLTIDSVQTTNQTLTLPNIRQAETVAVQPQFTAPAASNPAGTASLTGVMMGLARSITPQVTGRLMIWCQMHASNSAANSGGIAEIRYGTGTAPANGAAPSGTVPGIGQLFTQQGATFTDPLFLVAVVTGLTLGTTYWVDCRQQAVTGGTVTFASVNMVVVEF